jgi:methyl-accepting chemotaxis protein
MDEVTQQNAALVEEAAAAAESLEEQARSLVRSVATFRLSARSGGAAPASLDFDGVIQAHMGWKHKLRSYLSGEGEALDPAVVSRDDKCVLGCWIHGEGKRYAGNSHYAALRNKHADFHACAGAVIRAKQDGDDAGARRLLLNEFSVLSDETIQEIRHMKQSCGGLPVPVSTPDVPKASVTPLSSRVRGEKSSGAGGKLAAPLPKIKAGAVNLAEAEWEEF